MAILTATEVTVYSGISASAATIASSGLIAVVQERITTLCNNQFLTDLEYEGALTFNATGRTVTASGGNWLEYGFAAGDEVYCYHSYKNDGYKDVLSISGSVLTLATGNTVVDELSGRSIYVSVVKWPADLKYTAAQMVAYDYDSRSKRPAGVSSRSLGPFSESYAGQSAYYGYPEELIAPLFDHRIVRLM